MSDCRKCADFSWCIENEECGLFKPKPQTNADRIRSMTDEELADWLTVLCWYPVEKYGIEPVKDWWVDWLKRDSEEWKKV